MGLPSDATVETITNEPPEEPDESNVRKTRQVSCSSGHDVYVTFSITMCHTGGYRKQKNFDPTGG